MTMGDHQYFLTMSANTIVKQLTINRVVFPMGYMIMVSSD